MKPVSAFAAGIALSLVATPQLSASQESRCRLVDVAGDTEDRSSESQPPSEIVPGLWEVCKVGEFEMWVLADNADPMVLLVRSGTPLVLGLPDSLYVYEGVGKILASMVDRDGDGVYEHIDYTQVDPETAGDYEQWDSDRDGCPDVRFSRTASGNPKREIKFMGRWLELVNHKDQYGYIHDGVFRPMGEALGPAFEQAIESCVVNAGGTSN